MEANQETSEVTNCRLNPTAQMEIDVSESSCNAVATLAKESYPVGSSSSSSRRRATPPFLVKVYDMVRKPETDSIISRNSTGNSFIVWDRHKFAAEILGKYFRHNNFSSFICQLNTYGFKKINWDRLEYQNECFQKGKKSWLKKIKRRYHGTQNVCHPRTTESEGDLNLAEKQKNLGNLMHEHDAFKEEMMNLKEMRETLECEMVVLEKHAQNITSKQQKILNYMFQEVMMTKKGLQSSDAAKEQGSDGENCTKSFEGHLDEGETSHRSSEKSPSIESADYALLEKHLMDDLNFGNVPKEERAKLQENHVIPLEDLIEGSADWTEFVKDLSLKARS